MKLACIDLGTNTFHLLIVEYDQGSFSELVRIRDFVYLAEDGIETLGASALSRAKKTITKFKTALIEQQISQCKIVSTAALRTASNGPSLAQEIEHELNFEVEIIDGLREAELIYKGTRLIHQFDAACSMIMDIGGGSVEFIIVKREVKIWAKSYPIGVAVLNKSFHHTEIITQNETNKLNNFLNSELADLMKMIDLHQPSELIGASGTFEVIQLFLNKSIKSDKTTSHLTNEFDEFYEKIIGLDIKQRIQMGVPAVRASLIIVALILIKYILKKSKINKIIVSPFALKEGLLYEMANI